MNRDEFVNEASVLVERHFPKGKTKMRGEAMVLIADITRLLIDKGVLTDGKT